MFYTTQTVQTETRPCSAERHSPGNDTAFARNVKFLPVSLTLYVVEDPMILNQYGYKPVDTHFLHVTTLHVDCLSIVLTYDSTP